MDTSQLAENKLIIIYMLCKMDVPVSLSYIQKFVLSSEYMDYFTLSSHISNLEENGYIIKNIEHNRSTYKVSERGREMLTLFENLISDNIKDDTDRYVKKNINQVKKEFSIVATYKKNADNDFSVICGAYEESSPLIELNIKVTTKKYAKIVCENWTKDASKYYLEILKFLLDKDND